MGRNTEFPKRFLNYSNAFGVILKIKEKMAAYPVLTLFLAGLNAFYKGFKVFYGFIYVDEIAN